jgi:hypothetical protein
MSNQIPSKIKQYINFMTQNIEEEIVRFFVSADIELPKGDYDEGIRGDTSRSYDKQMGRIGNLGVVFGQFVNLLGNFPWPNE